MEPNEDVSDESGRSILNLVTAEPMICVRPRENQVQVARTETQIEASKVNKLVWGFRHPWYKKWDCEATNRYNHLK